MIRTIGTLMVAGDHGAAAALCADADVTSFLNATGITDVTIANALCTLVASAKANGWWTKCNAIYPMVGDTETKHSYNLVNTSLYRLLFSGGWTHSSTGSLPNGSTGYADTQLQPSLVLTVDDTHLSYYSRTDTDSGEDIGANATTDMYFNIRFSGGYDANFNGFQASAGSSDGRGFFISTRTASNNLKSYKNGSQVATSSGASDGLLPTVKIFIGAYNASGSANLFGSKECAFATIGAGISGALAATMYTDIQTFQTALSRQV